MERRHWKFLHLAAGAAALAHYFAAVAVSSPAAWAQAILLIATRSQTCRRRAFPIHLSKLIRHKRFAL